jgi:hypothetical protein
MLHGREVDPDRLLREIRRACEQYLDHESMDSEGFVALVVELDEWLTHGRRLPSAWIVGRERGVSS